MKKLILTAALAATALGGAAVAYDQTQPAKPPRAMRADTNQDGVVSREEFMAGATARFARLDTNHDNRIDRTEHRAQRQKMREHRRMHHRGGPTPTATPGA